MGSVEKLGEVLAVPTSVFVSYRRDDSKHAAGRLSERLDERFKLFMDIDSIGPGADFTVVVQEAVDQADILVAVIGAAWLTMTDETGARRIDNPEDWVAVEIGTALQRGTPVIPVLVDGARMPTRSELPSSLVDLASRQAITLAHESFASDCTRLIDTVDRLVGAQQPPDVDLWADPDYPAARSALLQGQWAKAIEGLERVHRRHPRQQPVIEQLEDARRRQTLIELDERARGAAAEERWGAAVDALKAMLALHPSEDVEPRLTEAKQRLQVSSLQHDIRALATVGDWAGVIAADGELTALDPQATDLDGLATHARDQLLDSQLDADYLRGVQQLDSGQWSEGESTFTTLLEQRPGYRDSEALRELARRRGEPADTAHAPIVEPNRGDAPAEPLTNAEPVAPNEPEEPAARLRGRWHWFAGAATLVVLIGAGAAVAMTGDDPEPEPKADGPTSSPTPTAEVLPTGQLVASTAASPPKASGRVAMAGRVGGVRVTALGEVEQVGIGDDARVAADDARLVAFTLADGPCQDDCRPWSRLDLKVAVDGKAGPLPAGGPTFVVAAEQDAEIELVYPTEDFDQRVSLLTGEATGENIEVLLRSDRKAQVRESKPMDVTASGTSADIEHLDREVTVGDPELNFWELDGAEHPKHADEAYLNPDLDYYRPGSEGCTSSSPCAFTPNVVSFRDNNGELYRAVDVDDRDFTQLVFVVPADLTGGTLIIAGPSSSTGISNLDGEIFDFTANLERTTFEVDFTK